MGNDRLVLILGGGINGAAVARELVLNRIPVVLVDRADISSGATAASSRLVHGGLRYLEYADFALVRESLAERERLLTLAPDFVHPLRFFIPVEHRVSGLLQSSAKFLRARLAAHLHSTSRGLWLIRAGLHWYDRLAHSSRLPRHAVHRTGAPRTPPVDARRFRWLCSYYDAQMAFPERFVVALLHDTARIAAETHTPFRVLTYHQAALDGHSVTLTPRPLIDADGAARVAETITPALIINATGAWVDETLRQLAVPSDRLMGGTKGSHFLTRCPALRSAIGADAIYAEAADGRPVFLLPFGPFTMVGTTDLPVNGDPLAAATNDAELDYLIHAVRRVFPDIALAREDISFYCCGVRPLPYARSANPAAVSRRHMIVPNANSPVPLLSLVGGKLTSCRQLAEEVAAVVLDQLGLDPITNSRRRPLTGDAGQDRSDDTPDQRLAAFAETHGFSATQAKAVWRLCGGWAESLLAPAVASSVSADDVRDVSGTSYPRVFVRQVIDREWCNHLTDLVTRRLLLMYTGTITWSTLRELAGLMHAQGRTTDRQLEHEIEHCVRHLRTRHGMQIE